MKMIKLLTVLLLAIGGIALLSACKKDDLPNNGQPRIRYVRITDPTVADSLLVGAGQGNLIAIIGENLQDTREIWFNDQKAVLTPAYITAKSILVSVPSQIPLDITNKVRLVFANGSILEYDFEVQISEPTVTSMNCEFVAEGGTAVIRGDYFYEPLTVTFAGGVTGEVLSVDDQLIEVKVPAGAEPGPVTVSTNFGTTESDFWFRDNRNIVVSSDPFTGWWNSNFVVTAPGAGDPPLINGNYIRVRQLVAGWQWMEVVGGPATAMGDISKNIPDEAILKPELYNLKFEVNTVKPYNNNVIKFNFGLTAESNNGYAWAPPFDTQGAWQTVTISFDELTKSYGTTLSVSPDGYWCRVLFHGPGELDADISFDNFRIVPKIIED